MGNAAVKQHYETAAKSGVFKLSDKLTEFPIKLYDLKLALRTIDLSENKLKNIPEEIGCFINLKQLRLNRNRLSKLPESIGLLSKLEILYVMDNVLQEIPASLQMLTNLKQVNFSGNLLTEFPLVFKSAKSLDLLDLSRNKITAIPDGVIDIEAVELILNRNQISSISPSMRNCRRLKTLRLEENCLELTAIPTSLLKDSNVAVLTLEGNLFEMKALADLDGFSNYMDRYTAMKKKIF